jgi:hypothetical protein
MAAATLTSSTWGSAITCLQNAVLSAPKELDSSSSNTNATVTDAKCVQHRSNHALSPDHGDGGSADKLSSSSTVAKRSPVRKVFPPQTRRKLVIVGDGATGKTALLIRFSKGDMIPAYLPTVFEIYVTDVEVDGEYVELALWDTAGIEDYKKLRPLSYPDTHVVLICFRIDGPDSLDNVYEKVGHPS